MERIFFLRVAWVYIKALFAVNQNFYPLHCSGEIFMHTQNKKKAGTIIQLQHTFERNVFLTNVPLFLVPTLKL